MMYLVLIPFFFKTVIAHVSISIIFDNQKLEFKHHNARKPEFRVSIVQRIVIWGQN